MVFNDAKTGARGIPNSECWEKLPDGDLTRYDFNGCGHRAGMECGPKALGVFRIVMIGSSFAIGMRVPREQTFAALIPQQLSQQLDRKIELYNESMPWRTPHVFAQHFDEVLAAQPDLVLWVVTPVDIENELTGTPNPEVPAAAQGAQTPHNGAVSSLLAPLRSLVSQERTGFLLRHFLYESPSRYVRSYLARGSAADYLKVQPGGRWEQSLERLSSDAASIGAQASAAHVPVALVFLPERAQAAMIAMNDWPQGYNPFSLTDRLRSIGATNGITYIDILPGIRAIPSPEQGYFSVDGHPNAEGHAMISQLLAKQLTLDQDEILGTKSESNPTKQLN